MRIINIDIELDSNEIRIIPQLHDIQFDYNPAMLITRIGLLLLKYMRVIDQFEQRKRKCVAWLIHKKEIDIKPSLIFVSTVNDISHLQVGELILKEGRNKLLTISGADSKQRRDLFELLRIKKLKPPMFLDGTFALQYPFAKYQQQKNEDLLASLFADLPCPFDIDTAYSYYIGLTKFMRLNLKNEIDMNEYQFTDHCEYNKLSKPLARFVILQLDDAQLKNIKRVPKKKAASFSLFFAAMNWGVGFFKKEKPTISNTGNLTTLPQQLQQNNNNFN